MKCIVPSCKNDFHISSAGFSKHRFPNQPEKRMQWFKAIAAKDHRLVYQEINFKTATICSDHFTPDCFNQTEVRRTLLKTATPSLFGNDLHGVGEDQAGSSSPNVVHQSGTTVPAGPQTIKPKPVKTIRYLGDVSLNTTKEQLLEAGPKIMSQFTRKQNTIKRLHAKCRRLTIKVASMQQRMKKLKSKQLLDGESNPLQRPADDRFFDFLMEDDDDDDDDDLDQDLLQVAKIPKLDRPAPKPANKDKPSKPHAKFCLCNSCRKERVAKAMERAITPNKATQTEERGPQPVASPVPAGANQDSCRLCFSTDQLEPLCSGMIVVHDEMLDKIYLCTGILIIPRPKQSIFICSPCARLINSFHSYRQQVCSNNRAFNRFAARKVPEVTATIMIRKPAPPVTPATTKLPPGLMLTPVVRKVPAPLPPGTQLRKIVPKAPLTIIQPEIPIVPPVDIKIEPEDPLEGCGEPALKIPPPVPVVPARKPIKVPLPKIEVKTEPVPEPGLLMEAEEGGDELPEEETWKCWQCENSFLFQFECAKHMLQVHGENVAYIKQRMNLDELNANMLEMMSVHQRK